MSSAKGYYDNISALFGEAKDVSVFRGRWLPTYFLKEEYADEIFSAVLPTEERRKVFKRKSTSEQMSFLKLCKNASSDFVAFDKDQITVASVDAMKKAYHDASSLDGSYLNWLRGVLVYDGIVIGIELSLEYSPFKPVSQKNFLLWVGSSVVIPYEETNERGERLYHEDVFTLIYPERIETFEEFLKRLNRGDPDAKALFEKVYDSDAAFEIPNTGKS